MAQRQIVNGGFQDALGNPMGQLKIRLTQDANVGDTQLYASTIILVPLDGSGNVSGTASLWPTDIMTPSTAAYIVKAFSTQGQLAWGPHQVTLPSGAGSYDISQWPTTIAAV